MPLLQVLLNSGRTALEGVELVDVHTHEAVYAANKPMDKVYFPIDAVISVVTTLVDGTSVEVGSIGSEGTTGIFISLGASTVPNATFCQVDGRSFVMSSETFERYLDSVPKFRRALNAYAMGYINVLAQLVACNRLHALDSRCARWLLMAHRPRRQRHISACSGVSCDDARRASVGGHACRHSVFRRGIYQILARHDDDSRSAGLEKETCECYAVERRQFRFPQAQ